MVPTEEVTFELGEITGLDRPLWESCGLHGTSLVSRRVSWACVSAHTGASDYLVHGAMSDLQQSWCALLLFKTNEGVGDKVNGLQSHSWNAPSPAWCHITGHQICEDAVSSFLLLEGVGTHTVLGHFWYFLGPRCWLLMLVPAAPPRSGLLCRCHSSCKLLHRSLVCHLYSDSDIQRGLRY